MNACYGQIPSRFALICSSMARWLHIIPLKLPFSAGTHIVGAVQTAFTSFYFGILENHVPIETDLSPN